MTSQKAPQGGKGPRSNTEPQGDGSPTPAQDWSTCDLKTDPNFEGRAPMSDNPRCPHCARPLTVEWDGVPCCVCDSCERLWPASYFGLVLAGDCPSPVADNEDQATTNPIGADR